MTTLADLLDDLLIRHSQLSLAITDNIEALSLEEFARFVSIQTKNALRITRLMKERGAMEVSERNRMMDQALDELSVEWGIKL
jgi:hypothetical protein